MSRIRVLVIDDDASAQVAIRSVLSAAGMDVHVIDSPIGATQLIVREQIQCVVCDLEMPALRGDAFARLFRKTRLFDRIRIVLVSAAPLEELRRLEESQVADAVVHKSEVRTELAATIRRTVLGHAP